MTRNLQILCFFLALTGCRHLGQKRPNTAPSRLQDFQPSGQLDEKALSESLLRPSKFLRQAREIMAVADENLAKAREIIDAQVAAQDNPKAIKDSSAFFNCMSSNNNDPNKCAEETSLPPAAIPFLERAANSYLEVVAAYSPPVLFPNASDQLLDQNSSLIRVRSEYPNNVFVHEKPRIDPGTQQPIDFWDDVLDRNCAGFMSILVHNLCEDQLQTLMLYQLAFKKLEQSFPLRGSEQSNMINEYLRFYGYAEQKMTITMNLGNDASLRLSSLNLGVLNSQDIIRTSSLAVVGDPSNFLDQVEKYYSDYEAALQKAIDSKVRLQQEEINLAANKQEISRVAKEISNHALTERFSDKQAGYLEKEAGFLQNRMDKLAQANRDLSASFVKTFEGVFGAWAPDIQKVPESSRPVVVKPNGGPVLIPIPSGVSNGAIQLTAGANRYKANGIYFNNKPNLNIGWKLKTPKISCCKTVAKIAGEVSKINKQVINATVPKEARDFVQREVNNTINKWGREIDKNVMQPVITEVKKNKCLQAAMLNSQLISGCITDAFLNGGKGQPLKPATPEKVFLDQDQVYKDIANVWRAETDAGGYLLSSSIGRSAGVSTSSGQSQSEGRSVGVAFFASAGLSTSKGNSVGGGTSTGSSVSFGSQVGFLHPKAAAPNLRVGMLVGRFVGCKDPSMENIFPVGTSNVITFDRSTRDCSGVEIFINDNLAGAKERCGDEPCASDVSIPVEVVFYQSTKDTFQKMTNLMNSDEMSETLESAAFSNDPVGTGIRIFESQAKAAGIPEASLRAFRPVVEQAMTVRLNAKDMERLALDQKKMDIEVARSDLQRELMYSQLQLMQDALQSSSDMEGIRQSVLESLRTDEFVYRSDSNALADRLAYWYNVYRSSVIYHDPGAQIPDIFKQIRSNEDEIFNKIDDSEAKGDLKAADLLSGFRINLGFKKIIEDLKTGQLRKNLLTQNAVGHCYVSLKDLGLKSQKLFSPSPVVSLISSSSPAFDRQVAKQIKLSTGTEAANYYRIRIATDPSRRIVYGNEEPVNSEGMNAVLRCTSLDDIGMDKLIGMAVTFKAEGVDSIPPDKVFMTHEPLMYGVRDGRRVYRFIEAGIADGFFGASFDLNKGNVSSADMWYEADLEGQCFTNSGLPNWKDYGACANKILGTSIDEKALSAGVLKTFFNSYLGGIWDVYLAEKGTQAWRDSAKDLKLHFYFKHRTLLNASGG